MDLEERLQALFTQALLACKTAGIIGSDPIPQVTIETPKVAEHGDFATNVAMLLARQAKKAPRAVAQAIVDHFPAKPAWLRELKIAGPGFINITIDPAAHLEVLADISEQGARYGSANIGENRRCQIEFVSANPTGPLHVGHGRGAIFGDVLGNLLSAAGFQVTKEYYVNDSGVQIQTLGRSVYLRLEELRGRKVDFPAECYQGAYIADLARAILSGPDGMRLQGMNEADQIVWCGEYAGGVILEEIRADLAACGVTHDRYFFESELHKASAIEQAFATLRDKGLLYEQEGALWFRSTQFGDDKDRVVRKSEGSFTYFAADIAYHHHKFTQGYDRVIDIWGADHAGHVPRMKAAVAAIGYPPERLDCVLLQMVSLIRGGKVVAMSTRRAEYETLRDLVDEVGHDVCRYFFLMRSHNAQLDFDMELATAKTLENPVYYIQYAYARICSVFAKAAEQGEEGGGRHGVDLTKLALPEEAGLARFLGEYPRVIATAAIELEPHRVVFYLLELARKFQAYYTMAKQDPRYRVLGHDVATTAAKLYLLKSCRIVLENALRLLGLTAPERMAKLTTEEEESD
ncbi:MAG: arginine--tRNA ligase [Deltaproteobacteria bacterium]|nr:arginine--tRNA ligase [Deltaproteobacteria bacterium]